MSKLGFLGWDKHTAQLWEQGWVEMTQVGPVASGNFHTEDVT